MLKGSKLRSNPRKVSKNINQVHQTLFQNRREPLRRDQHYNKVFRPRKATFRDPNLPKNSAIYLTPSSELELTYLLIKMLFLKGNLSKVPKAGIKKS